jgi:hypothetical protein
VAEISVFHSVQVGTQPCPASDAVGTGDFSPEVKQPGREVHL